MNFDDTDQDEEVAMAGNRFAALSDHNSDPSQGGVRDIPSRRLVLVSQPLDAVPASDDEAKRAARAMSLVQVGELSAARQALEAASMAPRTSATLRALSDPERRPPVPREGLSREVAEPAEQFELEPTEFLTCLRKARRGAAPGPSGMTSDHLFPLLVSEADSELFTRVGSLLAVARVPHVILEAIRLGRLTALQQA